VGGGPYLLEKPPALFKFFLKKAIFLVLEETLMQLFQDMENLFTVSSLLI
jgi:hypothetical protein